MRIVEWCGKYSIERRHLGFLWRQYSDFGSWPGRWWWCFGSEFFSDCWIEDIDRVKRRFALITTRPKPYVEPAETTQPVPAKDGHGSHSPSVAVAVAESGHNGYLNPALVEVMMGYPIGWTVSRDWGTHGCLTQQERLSCG